MNSDEIGHEYQEFIGEKLGFTNYQTADEQYNIGENKVGIEIKFDNNMKNTGNLFIETAEKRNADNERWIASGIMRVDGCWGYLIGDYTEAYLFLKKHLKNLQAKYPFNFPIITIGVKTSRGFLLPKVKYAEKFKIWKHRF